MWEPLVHAVGVKEPHGRPAHDVQTKWPPDGEVYDRVSLLHETGLFCSRADPEPDSRWAEKTLHYEFAGKRENDGVEADKRNVCWPFAVV